MVVGSRLKLLCHHFSSGAALEGFAVQLKVIRKKCGRICKALQSSKGRRKVLRRRIKICFALKASCAKIKFITRRIPLRATEE